MGGGGASPPMPNAAARGAPPPVRAPDGGGAPPRTRPAVEPSMAVGVPCAPTKSMERSPSGEKENETSTPRDCAREATAAMAEARMEAVASGSADVPEVAVVSAPGTVGLLRSARKTGEEADIVTGCRGSESGKRRARWSGKGVPLARVAVHRVAKRNHARAVPKSSALSRSGLEAMRLLDQKWIPLPR